MPAIKTVVAPVDFSESSVRAARAALAWAERFGSELHVLHVVPDALDRRVASDLREFSAATLVEDWTRGTRDALEALAARLSTTPDRVRTAVRLGDPVEEITKYVQEQEASLIVMASQGRGMLSRALLGSVAEAVVREAPCPVLSVPESVDVTRWNEDRMGFVRQMNLRTIVALTDFSDISHDALVYAHDIATQLSTRLHVLHVVAPTGERLAYIPPPVDRPEELLWRAERSLMHAIEPFSGATGIATAARLGKPGETAVAYADEVNADVIVLATHGRGLVARLLLGSVTQHVLRHAHCPILTLNQVWCDASKTEHARVSMKHSLGAVNSRSTRPL